MGLDENHDEPRGDMDRLLGLVRAQQRDTDPQENGPFSHMGRDELELELDRAYRLLARFWTALASTGALDQVMPVLDELSTGPDRRTGPGGPARDRG